MPTKMLDYLRIALYATLAVLVLVLFQIWDKEHPKPVLLPMESSNPATLSSSYVPSVTGNTLRNTSRNTSVSTAIPEAKTNKITSSETSLIHVTTDVLQIEIDPRGGNINQVKLLGYPETFHSSQPVVLLNNSPTTRYLAQSGLLSGQGPDTPQSQGLYTAEQTQYALSPDQKNLQVKLTWQSSAGLKITKIFTLERNSYEIGVDYQIDNQSAQPWDGNLYLQLLRKNTPPTDKQGFVSFATYFGAAISSPDKPFEKISFKQMMEKNLNRSISGGWAAMIQHYFVSAWVPDKNTTSQYFSQIAPDNLFSIGAIGPNLTVQPGETVKTGAKFYAGPAITDQLEKVAPGLQLTIDYGWLWFISALIFWMMQHVYNLIGNWGWSIVVVTLIIKLMFYHLSAKSYRSMSALKKLQPRLTTLKEKYGNDKQQFTQATLELYKKEKVNPMSGCLPILVQIPVFIALYWVLIESVQLRHAPFILWIQDLSSQDPYYVLPILVGLSMFLQQRLNPPPADPTQARIMMLMPIIFTVLFIKFPAGLMLYWFVNNMLSFLQQWYIMRTLDKNEPLSRKAK